MVFPAVATDLVDVSRTLNGPCRFLYKLETQQPSGSFKLRGMSKLIADAISDAKSKNKPAHVYSSSGGNAGLAAAYVSKSYNVPCTVVLPKTAKQAALDKLTALGAHVIVHGAHWGEADSYLRTEIMADNSADSVYCHPFDNPILWDGHGEMVDEIAEQLPAMGIGYEKIKGIVCSCGGGGLYNGIIAGLQRNLPLSKVPLLVVETFQTPTFKTSVDAGKLATLTKIDTLSTSLAAPYIAQQTFDNYTTHKTTVALVDDLDAVEATVAYHDTFGGVIEPACGATTAVSMKKVDLLAAFGHLEPDDVVVFIVCGGSTVSPETMQMYRDLVEKRGN